MLLLQSVLTSIFENGDHKRKANFILFNHQPESGIKIPSDVRLRDHPRHEVGKSNRMLFLGFITTCEKAEPGERVSAFLVFSFNDDRRSGCS